jgi:hypothetical protein
VFQFLALSDEFRIRQEIPNAEPREGVHLSGGCIDGLFQPAHGLAGGATSLHAIEAGQRPGLKLLGNGDLVEELQDLLLKLVDGDVGLPAIVVQAPPAAVVVGVVRAEAVHLVLGGHGESRTRHSGSAPCTRTDGASGEAGWAAREAAGHARTPRS